MLCFSWVKVSLIWPINNECVYNGCVTQRSAEDLGSHNAWHIQTLRMGAPNTTALPLFFPYLKVLGFGYLLFFAIINIIII